MAEKKVTTIKIIDRLGEPFEYKNIKSLIVNTGYVKFVADDGVEHTTNAEYHVKEATVQAIE